MGFTSATAGPQSSVVYFSGNPTTTKYSAGSRSWRTNNPGLLGLGVLTAQHGAIGQVLGVAVFQNPQQGRNALFAALGEESFAHLTVPQALARLIPLYTPPPRETDPTTGEPLPWHEPETGVDLELTMSAVGGGQRQALADLIERRLQYVPGLITQEPLDTGTLNQANRPNASPGNLLINGRSAVHLDSGGTLSTIDICETPSGHGCKTRVYTNIAKSSDAARTACLTKVNGNPACTEESIFSKSSGDEAGRCGGVRSGTIKAKAEVVTSATNFRIEGKGALRQFDLMVSNNQNTPPAPLMQGGGARPPFLDTVGAEEKEPSPPPWRHDWHIGGKATRQMNGRWAVNPENEPAEPQQTPVRKHSISSQSASQESQACQTSNSHQMMDHGLRNAPHEEQVSNMERMTEPVKNWAEGVKERSELLLNDPLKAIDQSLANTYPLYDKLGKAEQEDVLRKVQQAQSNTNTQEPDQETINALISSMPLGGVAGVAERVGGKVVKNAVQIAREGGKHSGQLTQFFKANT